MAERPTGHQVPAGDEGGTPTGAAPGLRRPSRRTPSAVARSSPPRAGEHSPRSPPTPRATRTARWPATASTIAATRSSSSASWPSTPRTRSATRGPACSSPSRCPTAPTRSPAGGSRCWVCCRRWPTTTARSARDRYLEANPAAAYYIDFGDFTFYRLDVREHPLRRWLRTDELGRRCRVRRRGT